MLISSKIKQHERGKTCINFLTEKFKYLTPQQWSERVEEGRFTIEGVTCDEDTILNQNDILVYDAPPFKEPDADLNYSIILETDCFLAINKPGNLLVHKKGAAVTHNLIYQLRECHTPPFPTADIVNRLDRETSGIVLVSKDKESLKKLSSLFMDRLVEKEYLAIVHGSIKADSGICTSAMMPMKTGEIRSKQMVCPEGKSAETRYEVVRRWENYSLVRLFPKTGRTHQLRVHMAELGHCMVGDKLYGMSESEFLEWRKAPEEYGELEFPRQTLHCCALRFKFNEKLWDISADLPEDMELFITQLDNK